MAAKRGIFSINDRKRKKCIVYWVAASDSASVYGIISTGRDGDEKKCFMGCDGCIGNGVSGV
mgnify:CR=1 FL=1